MTEERWFHIVENHDDLAGLSYAVLEAIQSPDMIIRGLGSELLAAKKQNHKYIISVYKEVGRDGFVITAFLTTHIEKLKKRDIVWKK